jgi:ArsR family transcriptional regulator, cadmium/lead-responsive transcriptional repressor
MAPIDPFRHRTYHHVLIRHQDRDRLSTATDVALRTKVKLFRGLGDGSRLAILEALREGARSVGEVVSVTGLTQPNVSNHMACLLDCGLVMREQRGRFAYYGLADAKVEELLALAGSLLDGIATGVDVCGRYVRDA